MCRKRNVVLDRLVRNESAPCGRGSRAGRRPAGAVGGEIGERLPVELETHDGRALEHVPLVAGRPSRRAARSAWIVGGSSSVSPPSLTSASSCSTKSGLPSATCADPRAPFSSKARAAEEALDQLVGLGLRERLERQGLGMLRLPQAGRSSRSSGRARQRSRSGASRVQSARCSIRSSSVGSAQWMSSMTSTSGRSRARSRAPCAPPRRSPPGLLRRARPRARPRRAAAEDLPERPVGDALAVGQAAADEDVGLAAQSRRELAGEARLADARRAEHRDEPAAAFARRLRRRRARTASSSSAADERRIEPPLEGGRPLDDARRRR